MPSGPGTLLVCQSAMPKHLKGKKNKKVSLGLGPMVYLVLFHFEFCQILRGGGQNPSICSKSIQIVKDKNTSNI